MYLSVCSRLLSLLPLPLDFELFQGPEAVLFTSEFLKRFCSAWASTSASSAPIKELKI